MGSWVDSGGSHDMRWMKRVRKKVEEIKGERECG